MDPFRQLKLGAGRVTPAYRTRTKSTKSVLDSQVYTYHRWGGINGNPPTHFHNSYPVGEQSAVKSVSIDTTRRERIPGSDLGELSLWKAEVISSGRRNHYQYRNSHYYGAEPPGVIVFTDREDVVQTLSPAAKINGSDVDYYLYSGEVANAYALMQKHCIGMFKGITPQKRTYTLFRNIVELKDVPRGIIQLRNSFQSLDRLADVLKIPTIVRRKLHRLEITIDQVPKEYVSYWFGWRQLYSDSVNLLLAPNKIAKKIDLLVARNGQATTYRTSRKFEEHGMPPIGFQYNTLGEYGSNQVNSFTRSTELKMVVNTTFEFPPSDVPNFRKKEFNRQLGLVPTPIDLYNLIPWSWLVDWFTGLGDYLEVIEAVNSDRELINWGLITAKVDYKLTTKYTGKLKWFSARGVLDQPGVYTEQVVNYNHESHLLCTLQLRKDLATIMDVNATTDIRTLSDYQLSILGAIIYNGTKLRR